MNLILNLLSVPIKIILLVPVGITTIIVALAGYDDIAHSIMGIVFEKWFK
jgi:hypothetical protein